MINAEGLAIIKKYEGCSLKPYYCPAGVATIGFGHTRSVTMKDAPITKEEAEELLKRDVEEFEDGVLALVSYEKLHTNQLSALVSFAYNLGLGSLKRSTLLRLLNESRPLEASGQFLRWNKAGGKVLRGLTKRRESERLLFLKPAIVVNRNKRN